MARDVIGCKHRPWTAPEGPRTLLEAMSARAERSANAAPHIHLGDDGVAWIAKTRVKVIEVVLDKLAHGWSPEEIHLQHRELSLAQIHAALSWYYDHQAELDAEIERRIEDVDAAAERGPESPLRARLRCLGHLR